MAGRSAREITRIPLGATAEQRYGAPFLTIHRADLQAALADAARAKRDISLKLGVQVADFAVHDNGVTVQGRRGREVIDERGIALIGADGVWSALRSASPGAAAALCPPHRLARAAAGRRHAAANSARRWCICGSARTRISSITR